MKSLKIPSNSSESLKIVPNTSRNALDSEIFDWFSIRSIACSASERFMLWNIYV